MRYWDRITHPAQLLSSLPQVTRTLLDPADCGPAFLGLPQDVAATAFDYPVSFFEPVVHRVPRPRADRDELERAAAALRAAERPVLIAGGGVHYSLAEAELADFALRHGIPVVETVAGKSSLVAGPPEVRRAGRGHGRRPSPTRPARRPTSSSPSAPGSTTSSPGPGPSSTTTPGSWR